MKAYGGVSAPLHGLSSPISSCCRSCARCPLPSLSLLMYVPFAEQSSSHTCSGRWPVPGSSQSSSCSVSLQWIDEIVLSSAYRMWQPSLRPMRNSADLMSTLPSVPFSFEPTHTSLPQAVGIVGP